jgi:hypothetical protein
MRDFRTPIEIGRDKSGKRWFIINRDGRIHAKEGFKLPDGRIKSKDGVHFPVGLFWKVFFDQATKGDRVFPVKPPGKGLVPLARHICSAQSFEQVFEPAISDLQFEYSIAISQGKLWKARRHYFLGCCAFWKTVVIFGLYSAVKMLRRKPTKA